MINYKTLNEKEKKFLIYAFKHKDLLLNEPISKFAGEYHCGLNFIYKFFRKYSINGVKDFISIIVEQSFLIDKLGTDNSELGIYSPSHRYKNFKMPNKREILINMVSNKEIVNYKNSRVLLSQLKEINNIVDLIKKNEIIYGFGLGHASVSLDLFFSTLIRFGFNCRLITKTMSYDDLLLDKFRNIKVIFICSVRGENSSTLKFATKIRLINKSVKIIVITTNPKSFLIKVSNFKIIFYSDMQYYLEKMHISSSNKKYLNYKMIISPINSLTLVTEYLTELIYLKNYQNINKNSVFIREYDSWIKNKLLYS